MGRAKRWRVDRLPEKLLQVRKNLNLSQNDLIRELKLEDTIYQTNISGYESGEREPPLPILLRYARFAGINLEILVDDELDLPEKLPNKRKIL
jgi:transcriptional regulator with XRE-family HTH domain